LPLTVTSPVYHFDGKIVYSRDNDLYLMEGSNTDPVRLTFTDDEEEIRPRFNWTGDKLVFKLNGLADIGIIDLKGDRQIQPINISDENTASAPYFWYSDNLTYQDSDPNGNGFRGIYMRRPNGSLRMLNHDTGGLALIGGITPGGLVFYESGSQIFSHQSGVANSQRRFDAGYDPKLATTSSPSLVVYGTTDNHIALSDFSGNIQILPGTGDTDFFPALSPDEQHIVFISSLTNNRDLYMMNIDGTGLVNLTNTPDIDETLPDWGN
jgi:Tol biopolymer transport system component